MVLQGYITIEGLVFTLYKVVSEAICILDHSRLNVTLKQGLLYSNLHYNWIFWGSESSPPPTHTQTHWIEPWYTVYVLSPLIRWYPMQFWLIM